MPFEKKKKLADKFLELGFSPDEISAMVGNAAVESAYTFDPTIEEKDSQYLTKAGKGFGLFQFTGPRRDALIQWSKDNNKDPNSSDTQAEFVKHELDTTEKRASKKMDEASSVEEKTSAFMKYYERPNPKVSHEDKRIKEAKEAKESLFIDLYDEAQKRGEQLPMKKGKPFIEKKNIKERMDSMASLLPAPPVLDPSLLLASTDEKQVRQVEQALINKADVQSRAAEDISQEKQELDSASQNLQSNIPEGMVKSNELPVNKESISPDLKEALMFFAPQAAGMALGAAFEGTQGAIAGAEEAGKLRDAFADFKFKKMEVEQKIAQAKQNYQLAGDYADEQGRPITFDRTTNKFFSMDGNPLDTTKIRNLKNERSAQFANLQQQSFDLRAKGQGQLSDKQVESLASADALDRLTGEIDALIDNVSTGPLSGRFQSAMSEIGMASDEFVTYENFTKNLTLQFTKFLTGAQMTDAEAKRIAALIPNETDSPKTGKAKLEAFKRYMKIHKGAIANSIKTGQPLRSDVVSNMVKDAESLVSGVKSGKREVLMSPDQKARLEELKRKYNK